MSRKYTPLWAILLLAYAALTIFLWPHAEEILPVALEKSPAAAAAELASIPAQAPLALITEPDDGIGIVLDSIASSTKTLDLVIYELQDPQVEQALVDATNRGVVVRIILQNINSFGNHPNQTAYDFLKAHNVPVQWAQNYFALTHQKTLIVDGSRALIMTFNLQPQYYPTSRDFGVIDDSPADVAAIVATFNSDWEGARAPAKKAVDLVWSPGSAPVLLALIQSASSTLDIYTLEMEDERVTQALKNAATRGVAVRVNMTYATTWKTALNELTGAGVHVRTYPSSASFFIHAKVIVADKREAFVGSENFSTQSLDNNRELGLIIVRPDIIESLLATFEHDWAGSRPYTVKQ